MTTNQAPEEETMKTESRWQITVRPMPAGDCNGNTSLFKLTAIRNDRQVVLTAEKLTEEMVRGYDPDHVWRCSRLADNQKARMLREMKS